MSAGGADVTVEVSDTASLTPGSYGKLIVKEGATLNLSGGTYVFKEINADKNATFNFDVSGDPIVIGAENRIDLQEGMVMTGTGVVSDILWQVAGGDVKLGRNGIFLGTFIAPYAHIDVHEDANLRGALYAQKIQFKKNASIIADAALDLFIDLFVP